MDSSVQGDDVFEQDEIDKHLDCINGTVDEKRYNWALPKPRRVAHGKEKNGKKFLYHGGLQTGGVHASKVNKLGHGHVSPAEVQASKGMGSFEGK